MQAVPAQVPGPAEPLPGGHDTLDAGVFRALFAAYPDALLLVNPQGRILLGNATAAAMLGYSLQELAALSVDELVPDGIRPRHAAHRKSYAQAPRARPMGMQAELTARRKDASELTVEISLSPIQDGGVPLVVVAMRDVGSYPRVIQAQRRAHYSEQLALLGRVALNARDIQLLLDRVPEIAAEALKVEEATVTLLDDGAAHLRVVASVSPLTHIAVGQLLPNAIDTPAGYVVSVGVPVIVEDFRRERRFAVPPAYLQVGLVSGMAVPLLDQGKTVGTLSVYTRQARRFGPEEVHFLQSLANVVAAGMQRSHGEQALSHAQRLEGVGQLTGGIAHDFNNLLTVIQGNLQVLQDLPEFAGHDAVQQALAAAARASMRGAELTAKLLTFSRRQALRPASLDAKALLQSMAGMLRRTLDPSIQIEVQVAGQALAVLADPGQLEAALLNLAINARDAMPAGGSLVFSAGACPSLPADLMDGLDDAGASGCGFVSIAVTDTGIGMSEAVMTRAFEPFFTTKEPGRGTGLGLSTVYGFARQSSGAVAIDSRVSAGTTVTIYLPRPGLADASVDTAATPARVPAGLRVLLVEDDAEVRAVVCSFLQTLGCEVTQAASAEGALQILRPEAAPDLLLTDIALGSGMRGTALATQVQAQLPGLAVLLMSGYAAELLEADRDSPVGWELLRKPFTRQELGQAIARALSG